MGGAPAAPDLAPATDAEWRGEALGRRVVSAFSEVAAAGRAATPESVARERDGSACRAVAFVAVPWRGCAASSDTSTAGAVVASVLSAEAAAIICGLASDNPNANAAAPMRAHLLAMADITTPWLSP